MENKTKKSEKGKSHLVTLWILLGLLGIALGLLLLDSESIGSSTVRDALKIVTVTLIVSIIFLLIKLIKSLIPIIILFFGISNLGNSQECEKENSFNFAIGSSFAKTTAPLMPSIDLSVSFNPIEWECFYKPSFYGGHDIWRHSFGGGMNLYLFKPGQYSRFFISSYYVTNMAIETSFEDSENPEVISSDGVSLFLGFQVLDFEHFTFSVKAGEMYVTSLERKFKFALDIGFKYYFKPVENQTLLGFFPKSRRRL